MWVGAALACAAFLGYGSRVEEIVCAYPSSTADGGCHHVSWAIQWHPQTILALVATTVALAGEFIATRRPREARWVRISGLTLALVAVANAVLVEGWATV
jgi:hypothetical protein